MQLFLIPEYFYINSKYIHHGIVYKAKNWNQILNNRGLLKKFWYNCLMKYFTVIQNTSEDQKPEPMPLTAASSEKRYQILVFTLEVVIG